MNCENEKNGMTPSPPMQCENAHYFLFRMNPSLIIISVPILSSICRPSLPFVACSITQPQPVKYHNLIMNVVLVWQINGSKRFSCHLNSNVCRSIFVELCVLYRLTLKLRKLRNQMCRQTTSLGDHQPLNF